MKNSRFTTPSPERDKLRRFRELDDAFAQALRELDDPEKRDSIPTGPPVRSLAALEQEAREKEQAEADAQAEARFKSRFAALMRDSPLSHLELCELIQTLVATGQWKADTEQIQQLIARHCA